MGPVRIMLASSPRRRELLERMGIEFLRSSRPGGGDQDPATPPERLWRSSPARRRRRWP